MHLKDISAINWLYEPLLLADTADLTVWLVIDTQDDGPARTCLLFNGVQGWTYVPYPEADKRISVIYSATQKGDEVILGTTIGLKRATIEFGTLPEWNQVKQSITSAFGLIHIQDRLYAVREDGLYARIKSLFGWTWKLVCSFKILLSCAMELHVSLDPETLDLIIRTYSEVMGISSDSGYRKMLFRLAKNHPRMPVRYQSHHALSINRPGIEYYQETETDAIIAHYQGESRRIGGEEFCGRCNITLAATEAGLYVLANWRDGAKAFGDYWVGLYDEDRQAWLPFVEIPNPENHVISFSATRRGMMVFSKYNQKKKMLLHWLPAQ